MITRCRGEIRSWGSERLGPLWEECEEPNSWALPGAPLAAAGIQSGQQKIVAASLEGSTLLTVDLEMDHGSHEHKMQRKCP